MDRAQHAARAVTRGIGYGDVLRPHEEEATAVRQIGFGRADILPAEANAAGGDLDVEPVRVADEAIDEGRRGPIVDLVRRADLLDAAPVQNRDTIRHFEGFFLIVGHEDCRVAGAIDDVA